MAAIVELREMSDGKLEEQLENAREEMFNLRFRHASSRLDDISQLRRVRREIAQYETVLQMRELAVDTAAQQPEIAAALKGEEWFGEAHFDYHESAWAVEFSDNADNVIVTALVDLNQKKTSGSRKDRRNNQKAAMKQSPVKKFEVVG